MGRGVLKVPDLSSRHPAPTPVPPTVLVRNTTHTDSLSVDSNGRGSSLTLKVPQANDGRETVCCNNGHSQVVTSVEVEVQVGEGVDLNLTGHVQYRVTEEECNV